MKIKFWAKRQPKNACPLCGCRSQRTVDEYLVCNACSEMLTPDELVHRATRQTADEYAVAMGYEKGYR